jgi:MazG family protein
MPADAHPELTRLLAIVARLRAPDGCPWDREQTEQSMAPHLLEETYEALAAIRAADAAATREELGDVLMNVCMIAQIAAEQQRYDLEQVAATIADKLVRRHPHVFGDQVARDSAQVLRNWEAIKRREKGGEPNGTLDGLPADLPALLRAHRIGEKAARVGFDWPDAAGPRDKLDEELAELDAALQRQDAGAIAEELGDVLFSVANLARKLGLNGELLLQAAADKFTARFRRVERAVGERLGTASLDELEQHWREAKE